MNRYILEVCSDSVEAALTAQRSGAQRIELCADLPNGGTTPSHGTIKTVRDRLGIKISVLIRPRPGNFIYTDDEFGIMLEDIRHCALSGCDCVVTGILNPDGRTVDTARSGELAALAHSLSMEATFHRAFDCCADMPAELEKIIGAGFDRVLTSGGQPKAQDGMPMLRRLVEQAGERISIMPGSGVRPGNIKALTDGTGAREFHGSFQVPYEIPGDQQLEAITGKYTVMKTDPEQVRQAVKILNDMDRMNCF